MIESNSGIKITDVRVSNFRTLRNIEVSLGDLTILLGANNAGKTSFLDALYAAIGSGRKLLGQDEVRLEGAEALPPKDRVVTVDIRIRPVGDGREIVEAFPEGSFWTSLWGTGIQQDLDGDYAEFVGIRTTLAWSVPKGDYVLERRFLKEWHPFADWLSAPVDEKTRLNAAQVEPLALHYIDAKRDLEDDIRKQGSFWRRMTEDLGLSATDVESFEQSFSALNHELVGKSRILKHLKENLADITPVVSSEGGDIDISPVARKLRDLSKGVDVSFTATGAQSFPLSRHGMGTRSLASLLVFRAFASWKAKQAADAGDHIHSILALEEPEAHLHPQAQRSFFAQVKSISGQRVVSTHSPYFAGQASLGDLRLFIRSGGETTVTGLDASPLDKDDQRKLRHAVIGTRGDLLFSRAVVFFEGETEEQALPVLAESYWGCSIHELGFSFVRVGGSGNYFPFIWLAERLNIPWYVFSDGEQETIDRLGAALHKAGAPALEGNTAVIVLPDGKDFEAQLLSDGYLQEIEIALDNIHGKIGYLDTYIERHHGLSRGKNKPLRDYQCENGRLIAAADALDSRLKTRVAEPLAEIIASLPEESRRFPGHIRALFEKISADHGLKPKGEEK